MSNHNGHEGGEAGGEHEPEQLPLALQPDGELGHVGVVGADGEAGDGVGGQLQQPPVHDAHGNQTRQVERGIKGTLA